MAAERLVLPIRIVENPVPGVRIALQRGATARAELIPPVLVWCRFQLR